MSLAKGIKKGDRLPIVRDHRAAQFQSAMDKYIDGVMGRGAGVPAEYVTERGKKLKAIKRDR